MKNEEFQALLRQYEPIVQAIVELFHPFVEAAVHDLASGTVVAIYHNISQRKVGESSPLKELQVNTQEFPDYFAPYYKQNWDGRPLKCTSITLRNKKGVAIGLICINVDTSFFQEGQRLIQTFLKVKDEAENPIEIFGSECEGQAESVIQQFLDEHHLSLSHLTRNQKRELAQQLYRKGIFNFKNAVPYIAKKLKTSRTSIYNYMKQIGE